MIGPEPECYYCKHFQGEKYVEGELRAVYYCAAFPDGEGIPGEIWLGRKHTKPIKGDHGVQFESADHRFPTQAEICRIREDAVMQPEPKNFPFSRSLSPQNVSAKGTHSFSFFITCAVCGTLSDADHGTIVSVVEYSRSASTPPIQSGELSDVGEVSEKAALAMESQTASDDEFSPDVVNVTIPVRVHLRYEPIGDFLNWKYSNGKQEGETWAEMWGASPRKARFLSGLRGLDAIPAFLYRAWYMLANRGNVPCHKTANRSMKKTHFRERRFFTGIAEDMKQDDESVGRVAFFPEWKTSVFGFRNIGMLFRFLFREVKKNLPMPGGKVSIFQR